MARPKILFYAGLLLCTALCLGWADTWDDIHATAGDVNSVQSVFVQKKHLPILSQPLVSTGALCFQRPGSLRWEYLTPIPSVLLMHEGRIRRFIKADGEFREETHAGLDAMGVVLEQITHWLAGRFDEDPMFKASLQPGRVIVLTPRDQALGAVLQHIELHLGDQPGMIRQVLIYEGPDAVTELTFTQTVLNQVLDPGVFQLVP